MITLLSVFKVLVPMAYLVVWGLYLWLFTADHPTARRLCSRFAAVTAAIHLGALTAKGLTLGRLPMGGPLEFSNALALAMLLAYILFQGVRGQGAFRLLYFMPYIAPSVATAVVFKRIDTGSGEERYIYPGNDGTSFPWNDTAQLDYVKAEVREATGTRSFYSPEELLKQHPEE